MTLYAYGHSYLAPVPGPEGRTRYLSILAEHFDMPIVNHAVSGSTADDVAGHVLRTSPWVPGTPGVVIVDTVVNDVGAYGNDAKAVAAFSDSLELIVRVLCAGTKTEQDDSSVAYGAGWGQHVPLGDVSGSTVASTTRPGAHADITFSGDEITLLSLRYREGTPGGRMEVVDPGSGRVIARTSATGGLPAASGREYHETALTVGGWGPGRHTVRVRKAVGDSGPIWLDGYLTPSDAPPTILLMKAIPLDWSKVKNTSGSAAALLSYNNAVDAVAGRFRSHVYTVDPARVIPPDVSAVVLPDHIHLNSRGHALYAQATADVLQGADLRPGRCSS